MTATTKLTNAQNALQQAGITVYYLYEVSEPGVFQAEVIGRKAANIIHFQNAGFTDVKAEQDYMGDEPYTLIRFRLPSNEPQTAAYQAAVDNVWFEQEVTARHIKSDFLDESKDDRIDYIVDLEQRIRWALETNGRGLNYRLLN